MSAAENYPHAKGYADSLEIQRQVERLMEVSGLEPAPDEVSKPLLNALPESCRQGFSSIWTNSDSVPLVIKVFPFGPSKNAIAKLKASGRRCIQIPVEFGIASGETSATFVMSYFREDDAPPWPTCNALKDVVRKINAHCSMWKCTSI